MDTIYYLKNSNILQRIRIINALIKKGYVMCQGLTPQQYEAAWPAKRFPYVFVHDEGVRLFTNPFNTNGQQTIPATNNVISIDASLDDVRSRSNGLPMVFCKSVTKIPDVVNIPAIKRYQLVTRYNVYTVSAPVNSHEGVFVFYDCHANNILRIPRNRIISFTEIN